MTALLNGTQCLGPLPPVTEIELAVLTVHCPLFSVSLQTLSAPRSGTIISFPKATICNLSEQSGSEMNCAPGEHVHPFGFGAARFH
jgi:hypothetical protein